MEHHFSRRDLFQTSVGLYLATRAKLGAAPAPPATAPSAATGRSAVGLVRGENRIANIKAALELIDADIRRKLVGKKSVVIKPNLVSTNRQLAATHADALRGIIDYLGPRWKGPIFIAESSAGNTFDGYKSFKYDEVVRDFKGRDIKLVDLNEEGVYETVPLLDGDLHPQNCRLAKRLCDPDAFVISAGMFKTHNVLIATLNVKNLCLGAPLHSSRRDKPFNDKRIYHGGVRQTHYDVMVTAQKLAPAWGLGVLDAFEGMEGNGPSQGTPVNQKVALASTDFIAADRIGTECMGINPDWMGYLQFCEKAGVGNYNRAMIDVRGESVDKVKVKYRLHNDIDQELQWMGPLTDLPPKLG
ncbi:MAG: DUF362 domain-containing protein [Bryobacteraceae bacterium]|nr:DUF362 domain-containing protein [Bryobacteraceae bacterium]